MESNAQITELNKSFPCLMEFKLAGDISAGIFMMTHTKGAEYEYEAICLVPSEKSGDRVGDVWRKSSLDLQEWFFLPKTAKVTLFNY